MKIEAFLFGSARQLSRGNDNRSPTVTINGPTTLEIPLRCAYTVSVIDTLLLELSAEHYAQRFSQRCSGPLRRGGHW